MAPEPEILKRKRSRPSEWWAAAPLSSPAPQPQQAQPARANIGVPKRGIKDAPAAGNRGNTNKTKVIGNGDGESGKSLRRGRPSNTEDELSGVVEENAVEKESEMGAREEGAKNRGRPTISKSARTEDAEEPAVPEKRCVRISLPVAEDLDDLGDAEASIEETSGEMGKHKRRGLRSGLEEAQSTKEPQSEDQVSRKKRKGPLEVEGEESGNSLRRGRSSNTEAEVQAIFEQATKPIYKNKRLEKKGGQIRSSDNEVNTESAVDEDPRTQQKVKKPKEKSGESAGEKANTGSQRRGRSSNSEAEVQAIFEQATKPQYRGKKRDPPVDKLSSATGTLAPSKGASQSINENSSAPERRGRVSNSTAEGQETFEHATKPKYKGKQKEDQSRGRRSGTVLEVEAATSAFARDRNKPKRSRNDDNATHVAVAGPSKFNKRQVETKKDGRQKLAHKGHGKTSIAASNAQSGSRKRKEVENRSKDEPQSTKRRMVSQPSQSDYDEAAEQEEVPQYQHLTAVTRKVSRQTIEAKWEQLPLDCVERISQLLHDIERPIIVHLNEEHKKIQASTALQIVSRRIVRKISKGIPFPRGTWGHREDDFDFEKILDHNRSLEALLTPTLHANELLEAELAKEIALLEAEQDALADLEANAKTEASMRKQAQRKLHSLLQSELSVTDDDLNRIGLSHDQMPLPLSFDIQRDENLQGIVKDLGGHVDSIEGNINQVKGITHAMARTKAAVQGALFDHLERTGYEDVVLG